MLLFIPILLLNVNIRGTFSSIRNAFAMCVSNIGLTAFEERGHDATVIAEAIANAQNYEFSSMICMMALSSVINRSIESYYPITNDLGPPDQWDSWRKCSTAQ